MVDDLYESEPSVKLNIPDVEPIVGLRFAIKNVESYFNLPKSTSSKPCTYYKARRSKNTTTTTDAPLPYAMLPYWMHFYE